MSDLSLADAPATTARRQGHSTQDSPASGLCHTKREPTPRHFVRLSLVSHLQPAERHCPPSSIHSSCSPPARCSSSSSLFSSVSLPLRHVRRTVCELSSLSLSPIRGSSSFLCHTRSSSAWHTVLRLSGAQHLPTRPHRGSGQNLSMAFGR